MLLINFCFLESTYGVQRTSRFLQQADSLLYQHPHHYLSKVIYEPTETTPSTTLLPLIISVVEPIETTVAFAFVQGSKKVVSMLRQAQRPQETPSTAFTLVAVVEPVETTITMLCLCARF